MNTLTLEVQEGGRGGGGGAGGRAVKWSPLRFFRIKLSFEKRDEKRDFITIHMY